MTSYSLLRIWSLLLVFTRLLGKSLIEFYKNFSWEMTLSFETYNLLSKHLLEAAPLSFDKNAFSRQYFYTGHGIFSLFFFSLMQNTYEWLCNVIIWWNDMKYNLDIDFDYNLIILFLILLRTRTFTLMWNWLNRMSKIYI